MENQDTYIFPCIMIVSTLTMCIFEISSEITTAVALKRANFDNKTQEDRKLWQVDKRGTSLCVAECSRDEKCASIFYNKVTGQCQAHSITFGDPTMASEEQNWRYYVRPHGEQYIGDSCSTVAECLTPKSECRTGTCLCAPGYSFSPRTHECKECINYGSEYMEIRDHYISQRNMKIIDNRTLRECLDSCNTEFSCVSLEYGRSTGTCYLANITVLDVEKRWYEDVILEFNISYYQRDCDD